MSVAKTRIVALVLLVVAGAAVWRFWPGARRVASQSWAQMNDQELTNNWAFYYDESIGSLKKKVSVWMEKQVDFRVAREEALRRVKAQEEQVQKIARAVGDFGKGVKAAGDADGPIVINGIKYDDRAKAVSQLRLLATDLKKQTTRLGTLAEQHRKSTEATDSHMVVVGQLQERIRELEEQKQDMDANLEISKVRQDLAALASADQGLTNDLDIKQLQRVKGLIDKEVLRADVVAQLTEEDQRQDQQRLSSPQYLRKLEQDGTSSEIDEIIRQALDTK